MGLEPKVFVRKPYDKRLYKWSPPTETGKNINTPKARSTFCNATPNSQGEDFVTTYVHNQTVINGVLRRFAYVACNYVK